MVCKGGLEKHHRFTQATMTIMDWVKKTCETWRLLGLICVHVSTTTLSDMFSTHNQEFVIKA